MSWTRIQALDVLAREPLTHALHRGPGRQRLVQHRRVCDQTDEAKHDRPGDTDPLSTTHQRLPPGARRFVSRSRLVVGEHEQVDVGDDHRYEERGSVPAKRRVSSSSLSWFSLRGSTPGRKWLRKTSTRKGWRRSARLS